LNTQEWDDLFETSYQQNMRQKAAREKRIDYNQKRQLLMQRNDTEDLYTLKVRLESEVQDLEQQLEDMRAPYQVVAGLFLFSFCPRKQRGAGPDAAARGHVALRPHTLVA
jgi:dynein regulatory complex protein 1